jgi:two-component system response regulator PilR (NtrC family)
MKRILIIDESEVIRETLALILGRDYIVSKRAFGGPRLPLAEASNEADLLIVGIAPRLGAEAAHWARLSAQLSCAVLFLVDSKSTARGFEESAQIACLAKPFNPYELHARVGALLAHSRGAPNRAASTSLTPRVGHERYLEFPYVSRSVASLAQRFAAIRLPILVSGELGCGQENVARALQALQANAAAHVSINIPEVSADYLARQRAELSQCQWLGGESTIVLIENLDKCDAAGQALLLRFLEDLEAQGGSTRCLTTASGDLLERVYGGTFLAPLYYRLATLTLKLAPLRERIEDIPVIADWFVRSLAATLQLVEAELSAGAIERLRNYFWFGNLHELETVIARTLAIRGGGLIDAGDLVFDFGGEPVVGVKPFELNSSELSATNLLAQPKLAVYNGASNENRSAKTESKAIELSVLIHELAHELKNPMVTIKTFAQLLADRYQDESFRARFQEIVGDDIERMDELLEVMIQFADFAQPKPSSVALGERLMGAVREIQSEANRRQARFAWKHKGADHTVRSDESQLTFILKNVLLAVLSHAKLGSEISVDMAQRGSVIIAYLRESARVTSITHYLTDAAAQPGGGILPLRILLAQQLVERNGGHFAIDQSEPDKDIFRLEFPIG